MSANGTAEEKLSWAFRIYDKDGSGTIELKVDKNLPEYVDILTSD